MRQKFKSLQEVAEFSVNYKGESKEFDCNINLIVDDVKYKAHSVSIAHRDLLFYCDKGCFNYVVDSYGDRHVVELFHSEVDDETP